MADKQISALPNLANVSNNDLLVAQSGSTAYKVTGETLLTYLITNAGISNIAYSSSTGKMTITYSNGKTTTTTDIRGQNGTSPTITATPVAKTSSKPAGEKITITDASGTTEFTLYNGADGTGAVTSVNGQSGAVQLSASDVSADASGTATTTVNTHNSSSSAHSAQFGNKENKGKITIGGTEYTVQIGGTPKANYITFTT